MTRESTLLTSTPYTIRRVLASSLSSFLASVGTERIFGQRRKGDVSGSAPGSLRAPPMRVTATGREEPPVPSPLLGRPRPRFASPAVVIVCFHWESGGVSSGGTTRTPSRGRQGRPCVLVWASPLGMNKTDIFRRT